MIVPELESKIEVLLITHLTAKKRKEEMLEASKVLDKAREALSAAYDLENQARSALLKYIGVQE